MGGIRNPFLFRATEQNNEDDLFVQLFSEDILNILKDNNSEIFSKPLILRSSPGFGKTSLLKLFTAQILKKLINYQSAHSDKNDLLKAVKSLEFIDEKNKIKRVGLYIPCTNLYTNIEDVIEDEKGKNILFFALLNSKVIFEFIQTLKFILIEKYKNFNDELVKILIDDISKLPLQLKEKYEKSYLTLKDFYDYAISVEKEILNYIDNFGLVDYDKSIKLANLELHSFILLSNCKIEYQNKKISLDFVIMFDDLHKLTKLQRDLIYKTILNDRYKISIWIAERLSILKDNSIFHGTTNNRDYINIHLEDAIRGNKANKKVFSNFLSNITKYRMNYGSNNIASFESKLSTTHETQDIEEAIEYLKNNLTSKYSETVKYKQLIEEVNSFSDNSFATLLKILCISIYIERNRLHRQQTFDFVEINKSETEESYGTLKPSAEYFSMLICELGYYYSFERITRLASYNTEQFLSIASNLYEEMIARSIINKEDPLSPRLQEDIIKQYADNKWNEIATNIINGREIQVFLSKLLDYSYKESIRPNAPYSPGVTGFGVSSSDLKKIQDEKYYLKLKEILMSCISYNLLTIDEDRKQGKKKSETVTIFYFNRWLCVKFMLPIGYGGWKKKKASDLNDSIKYDDLTKQFNIFQVDEEEE